MQYNRRTPGVYVTELAAFPPSVIGVQTAVPAFIGYTKQAKVNGKPVYMQPISITSLADYQEIFGGAFEPVYTITPVTDTTEIADHKYDFSIIEPPPPPPQPGGKLHYYSLTQESKTSQFNFYDSMRLFYANGGGNCFVVSVGSYEKSDGTGLNTVEAQSLKDGLDVIKGQVGPTMLVVPEAVLLSNADFQIVAQWMLDQCGLLQDRVAILDVYGGGVVDNNSLTNDLTTTISQFRGDVGNYLNYGMAYFPFLHSTVVPVSDYDFQNLHPLGLIDPLATLLEYQNQNLNWDWKKDPTGKGDGKTSNYTTVKGYIDAMEGTKTAAAVLTLNQNLMAALPVLTDIYNAIVEKNDVLPPSPAMAGVYTFIDSTQGVWNAPANVALSAVDRTTFKLNGDQQGDLNLPVDGKAVNAIREFVGRGPVVWGARTLDGNSNDYRYIQVRRTLIYIEQSIKTALNSFVFAPNDGSTWVTVTSMVSNFLQGLWSAGGLMGATAKEAYTVQCGLGSTMTGLDILNGYMIVQVTLQMIHPAEFIELTFKQEMQGVS
jgi:phage tail sheath protein FI